MCQCTNESDSTDESGEYFEGLKGLYDDIDEEILELRNKVKIYEQQRKTVSEIAELVEQIDKEHVSGEVTVEEDGTLLCVNVLTDGKPDEVEKLIEDYQWTRRFSIDYDTKGSNIRWTVKGRVDSLAPHLP